MKGRIKLTKQYKKEQYRLLIVKIITRQDLFLIHWEKTGLFLVFELAFELVKNFAAFSSVFLLTFGQIAPAILCALRDNQ